MVTTATCASCGREVRAETMVVSDELHAMICLECDARGLAAPKPRRKTAAAKKPKPAPPPLPVDPVQLLADIRDDVKRIRTHTWWTALPVVVTAALLLAALALAAAGFMGRATTGEAPRKTRPRPSTLPAAKPTHPPVVQLGRLTLAEFSGTGPKATKVVRLLKGLVIVEYEYTGAGHFAVMLMSSAGENIALVANAIGNSKGSQAVHVKREGYYLFNVTGDGEWKLRCKE